MDGNEVVDLALSDDDAEDDSADGVSIMCPPPQTQRQQIDLTDDLDPAPAVVAAAAADDDDDTVVELSPVQPHLSSQAAAAAAATEARAQTRRSNVEETFLGTVDGDDRQSKGASTATPRRRRPLSTEATSNSNNSATTTAPTSTAAAAVRGGVCRCAACEKQDVPQQYAFALENCGHRLCSACVVAHVSGRESLLPSSPDPVCPVKDCAKAISVRDLALVLQEKVGSREGRTEGGREEERGRGGGDMVLYMFRESEDFSRFLLLVCSSICVVSVRKLFWKRSFHEAFCRKREWREMGREERGERRYTQVGK